MTDYVMSRVYGDGDAYTRTIRENDTWTLASTGELQWSYFNSPFLWAVGFNMNIVVDGYMHRSQAGSGSGILLGLTPTEIGTARSKVTIGSTGIVEVGENEAAIYVVINDPSKSLHIGTDVVNSGRIIGGIDLSIADDTLINNFKISGGNISAGAGNDVFINKGIVDLAPNQNGYHRSINMGDGNDLFDSRGGLIVGSQLGSSNPQISLGAGNDTAYGSNEDDKIDGGEGNDLIYGGGGGDVLLGGAGGDDTVSYENSSAAVRVDLQFTRIVGGVVVNGEGGDADLDFVSSENLIGSKYSDFLSGDYADNRLFGKVGSDILLGRDGNDTLDGGLGADDMSGGLGNDTYIIDNASDIVRETFGSGSADKLISSVSYTLDSGVAVETMQAADGAVGIQLQGNEFNNVIIGGAGNDTLVGGGGADTLVGGAGDDVYVIDNPGDVIVENGGGGTDVIIVVGGVTLPTPPDNVEVIPVGVVTGGGGGGTTVPVPIIASSNGGTIVASSTNDILIGGKGRDALDGAAGDDKLFGRLNNDRLIGGTGKDIFVFDTKLNKKTNVDKIIDFSIKDDTIWIDNKYMTKIGKGTAFKPGKLDKKFFTIGAKAHDANDHLIYNKANGTLYYDSDGTGSKAAVAFATVETKLKLTAADFFVI